MNLKFLICNNCNLRCYYCHNEYQGNVDYQKDNNKKSFSIETIYEFLREYNVDNIDYIKISGGEPFLKPKEVCKILELSSSIKKKVVILTNATIHNSDIFNKIIEHDISEIRINLPTFDILKYKSITKASDKEVKVLHDNITYFNNNNIPISLNVVLSCHFNELEDFIKEYLTEAHNRTIILKSIRFIVNDWLLDKDSYFDKAYEILASLTKTQEERRRGRIIDFHPYYITISLLKCNMDEESDIYLLPPGVVLTNHIKGKAYD